MKKNLVDCFLNILLVTKAKKKRDSSTRDGETPQTDGLKEFTKKWRGEGGKKEIQNNLIHLVFFFGKTHES